MAAKGKDRLTPGPGEMRNFLSDVDVARIGRIGDVFADLVGPPPWINPSVQKPSDRKRTPEVNKDKK